MALEALHAYDDVDNEPLVEANEMESRIYIDGSTEEGGGQILRNASAYSVLLGRDITIDKIRMKRDRIGLRPQHLTGLQLLKAVSQAETSGLEVGSTAISFNPKVLEGGSFVADTGTAGSIVLLIQSALPVLLFAPRPSRLILKGGTHASMAPLLDYFTEVFLPTLLNACGIPKDAVRLALVSRGYYPKGHGECVLDVDPSAFVRETKRTSLPPICLLERGEMARIVVHSFTSGRYSKGTTTQRLRTAIEAGLAGPPFSGRSIEYVHAADPPDRDDAYGCLIVLHTAEGFRIGCSALGTYKTKPEEVARDAVAGVKRNWAENGAVDEYLQDQLIIFGSLASGTSRIRCGELTLHTRTAMWVAEQMCGVKWSIAHAVYRV